MKTATIKSPVLKVLKGDLVVRGGHGSEVCRVDVLDDNTGSAARFFVRAYLNNQGRPVVEVATCGATKDVRKSVTGSYRWGESVKEGNV
jgi:hypothetical protein